MKASRKPSAISESGHAQNHLDPARTFNLTWLGLASEIERRGQGVSCDGFFYRGRKVAVIGGGNTAVEEALYLTNHSDDVTLIHCRNALRCERILEERLCAHPKIRIIWNAAVTEFLSEGPEPALTGLRLSDPRDGTERVEAFDGAFVAIGHDPATALFRGHIDVDPDSYIVVAPGTARTSIPGVFAAGDVSDRHCRQAVTAAGTGCMAALDSERFLAGMP